jgi:uncharacterized RDD family membrane protein YckC
MHRSASLVGAVIGALVGLLTGAVCALLASDAVLWEGLGTDVPAGLTRMLILPTVWWLIAGAGAGGLVGRRMGLRMAKRETEPPPPPV